MQPAGIASSSVRVIIAAVLGLPMIVAAALFGPSAFDLIIHRRTPERYLIPTGYAGWVHIDYRQPGARPLPVERGRRVLRIDAQGRLQTSDTPPAGHAKDEFFSAAATGLQPLPYVGVCKGGMIWGVETRIDERTGLPFTRFFVGDEGEYRHEIDPSGRNFPSC